MFYIFKTGASNVCAIKATENVLKYLVECDKADAASAASANSTTHVACMDLSYSMPQPHIAS